MPADKQVQKAKDMLVLGSFKQATALYLQAIDRVIDRAEDHLQRLRATRESVAAAIHVNAFYIDDTPDSFAKRSATAEGSAPHADDQANDPARATRNRANRPGYLDGE